jgi:hypothetical protein
VRPIQRGSPSSTAITCCRALQACKNFKYKTDQDTAPPRQAVLPGRKLSPRIADMREHAHAEQPSPQNQGMDYRNGARNALEARENEPRAGCYKLARQDGLCQRRQVSDGEISRYPIVYPKYAEGRQRRNQRNQPITDDQRSMIGGEDQCVSQV